jgi:hypothetical protein
MQLRTFKYYGRSALEEYFVICIAIVVIHNCYLFSLKCNTGQSDLTIPGVTKVIKNFVNSYS